MQNEFRVFSVRQKGSKAYGDVTQYLQPAEIYLPQDDTVSIHIHAIINNSALSCAQDVYKQLAEIESADLRPHFLNLLKGFTADCIDYRIDRKQFETLHAWYELHISQYDPARDLDFATIQEAAEYLSLTTDQTSHLNNAADKLPLIERTVIYIPLPEYIIKRRVCSDLNEFLKYLCEFEKSFMNRMMTACEPLYIDRRALNMLHIILSRSFPMLKRIMPQDDEGDALLEKLSDWYAKQDKQFANVFDASKMSAPMHSGIYSRPLHNYIQKLFREIRAQVEQRDVSVIVDQVFGNSREPLIDMHHEKSGWFGIYLPPALRMAYFSVKNCVSKPMPLVYGVFGPEVLIARRIAPDSSRMGNLSYLTVKPKGFQRRKIHGEKVTHLADAMLHDFYHDVICANVFYDIIVEIVTGWMRLIGDVTGRYKLHEGQRVPFGLEVWTLADMALFSVINATTPADKLHAILNGLFLTLGQENIICYMLMYFIAQSNFYDLGDADALKSLSLFNAISRKQEEILKANAGFQADGNDADKAQMLSILHVYSLFYRDGYLHNISMENVVSHAGRMTFSWRKAAANTPDVETQVANASLLEAEVKFVSSDGSTTQTVDAIHTRLTKEFFETGQFMAETRAQSRAQGF